MPKSGGKASRTSFLDQAREVAQKRLSPSANDLRRLDLKDQAILAVSSAQGVIDNGGLAYFFEEDWPGQPSYSLFSDAYRRIGADAAARFLDAAAALFPFP